MNKEIVAKTENARQAETAIRVENLSKTFRIPHEKISTLRGAFVNLSAMLREALLAGVF